MFRRKLREDEYTKPELPGVVICNHWYCDSYEGTLDALRPTGYIRDDCIPGQPGQLKTRTRYMLNGYKVELHKRSKNIFYLKVCLREDEEEKRSKEIAARNEEQKKRKEAEEKLACRPATAAEYRKLLCNLTSIFLRLFYAEKGSGGFSLEPASVEKVQSLLRDADKIANTAPIKFSMMERRQEAKEIMGDYAPHPMYQSRGNVISFPYFTKR